MDRSSKPFGLLLFSCVVLSISCPAFTQSRGCSEVTIQMSLFNRYGQVVRDLNPSDFVARYHGKPARITSVAQDSVPRRDLILIDVSGSMHSTRTFDFDVAEELLNQLPPGTQVAVMAFAKETTAQPAFSADRDSVRRQLQHFREDANLSKILERKSALVEAMERSLSSFGTAQPGDVLYVISDSLDQASEQDWHTLGEALLSRGIRVMAMRRRRVDLPPLEHETYLPSLADSTGGSAVDLPLDFRGYDEAEHKQPLRDSRGRNSQVAFDIDLQARLILDTETVHMQVPERKRRKNDVDLRLAKRSNDLFLVYQHALAPCTESPRGSE